MKVFLAGATGVVGARLVPQLVGAGHRVMGTTRTPGKVDAVRALGAEPVLMDALDAGSVKDAVADAAPDVVVHQLTALPAALDPRRFREAFAETNRLRTEGTDHLVEAAAASGVRRFVAQSYAAWPYARVGGPIKTEDDPLDDRPAPAMRDTLDAILHLERAVTTAPGIDGLVLRYGAFYGPGTGLGAGGAVLESVRRRRFPVVGSGDGVWSFVHIDDAASATVAAIQGGPPGVYDVTDDEPAPVREWLPAFAAAVGAKPPRRVPVWVAKLLIGEAGVMLMTDIRGASNEKAKRELGWTPRYATWRDGFRTGLS
jgi:nucleoside-diphosphate-sugar epimerase